MIKLYTSPNCSSCKKAKEYLTKNQIDFIEKNIFIDKISKDELKDILKLTNNGSDDIISSRSNIIKNEKPDLESMTISDLIDYIIANPSILKRPLIIDDSQLQVGYNKENIKLFNKVKKKIQSYCKQELCPKYDECNSIYSKVLLQASDEDN